MNGSKLRPSYWSLAGAVVLSVGLLACHTDEGQKIKLIKFGAILPQTGDTASYGKAAQKGIDLAVAELNAAVGGNARKFQIIYEDDGGQTAKARSAMEKLIAIDKVPAVIGSAGSSVTLSLCPVANRSKVVLLSPISSAKDLTQQGGQYFFRVCPSDVVQAGLMAKWILEEGHRRAAVIFVNNSWGQGLQQEFGGNFRQLGGEVAGVEACQEGERDLRTQLTKVKAAKPEALYAITYGKEGGALLRQARQLGISIPIYGADVWGSPELSDTADGAERGVKILVPARFGGPLYEKFSGAFQKRYGEAPDTYAAYAYDAMMVLAGAATESLPGEALRSKLSTTVYEGVTGVTKFDEHGDVQGKGFARRILAESPRSDPRPSP